MKDLTLENLIDIREAITKRMKELEEYKAKTVQAENEQNRRHASLKQSFSIVENAIKEF
jgi:molybdopterin-biosynthesis enzyme MoeA-like protein